MTGRYGSLDYATLAKRGFVLGVTLFAAGALGELGLHAAGVALPAWERTLLFDAEVVGIAVALLSPLVFGIVLPLTE
jgi:hydrogenase/urease accessory protein HupE